MAGSDPRAAVLARQLQARLELERSLGVTHMRGQGHEPAGALAMPGVEAAAHRPASAASAGSAAPALPGAAPVQAPPPECRLAAVCGVPAGHSGDPALAQALDRLSAEAAGCTLCELSGTRTHVVFGEGKVDTDLLFIGEAPGQEEDKHGRPFVGRAGELLTRMIEGALKRPRASVYICNILKCRPPGNRDPQAAEVLACTPWLQRQVEIIGPKVIVALGRISGNWLLGQKESMGALRGRWWQYQGVPVRVIYHPSYLLRQRNAKGRGNPADRNTMEDLQAVARALAQGVFA